MHLVRDLQVSATSQRPRCGAWRKAVVRARKWRKLRCDLASKLAMLAVYSNVTLPTVLPHRRRDVAEAKKSFDGRQTECRAARKEMKLCRNWGQRKEGGGKQVAMTLFP
eukprot:GHVT01025956.1.p2 GENE.GHVT01025956.1~~GHVT01025956.1.p2  ORF type:complete len:109 (+),score=14.55 GHVT01025956.1:380-706(+)